jgi:hypothetical protein
MDQLTNTFQDRPLPVDQRWDQVDRLPIDGAQARNPTPAVAPWRARVLRELGLWLLSLALFAPALIPYASHYALQPPGRLPTGFIQYDLPYYLANAREYFDAGRFRLFYTNPYDPSCTGYESPAIYFQPMTLMMAALMLIPALTPPHVLLIFELLAGWVCARVVLALYTEVVGLNGWARRLGLVCFFWGGGVLTLAGFGYVLATGKTFEDILHFDPGHGWWCLNLGRNLVYPNESLYHALFFGCIYFVVRRRFWAAAILAFLESISHPYTGVELLLIIASWSAVELFFTRMGAVPAAFFGAILAILAFHIGYYLVYLPSFAGHHMLMRQWEQPWFLQAEHFVPAYALVGALALWSFRHLSLARTFFAETNNRLFLVWFLVAFAVCNHEFAIEPLQPLHFTRGYVWTPLFLMGSTTLVNLFTTLRSRGGRVAGRLAVAAVAAVLLFDNAAWLGRFPWRAAQGRPLFELSVTADQLALYDWMSRPDNRGGILITNELLLAYLAPVYSPIQTWTGHSKNTPFLADRIRDVDLLLKEGRLIDAWRGQTLLVTLDRSEATPRWPGDQALQPVFENATYRVYRLSPDVASSDRAP